MTLKIDEREFVVARIARDIANRPGLKVRFPHEVAERVVARRSDAWVRFFIAASNDPNVFKTKRQIGREAGLTKKQCDEFWFSLRAIHIDTDTEHGRVRLFRDHVELRFRHRGTIDDQFVEGGVCLHLANHDTMSPALNRTITRTTKKAVRTLNDNFEGATRRRAQDASVSIEERAEIEQDADEAYGGVRSRETLPLFKKSTGTDGE